MKEAVKMSIISNLIDLAAELANPTYWDNDDDDFILGTRPRNICRLERLPLQRLGLSQYRKRPYSLRKSNKVHDTFKDGFQVSVDVQQFKPSEIIVKTVDNMVVIEGKHEEREDDHGIISRHFVRRCPLPEGYDPNDVTSSLSSDGILTVKAPKPPKKDAQAKERIIQIEHTGPSDKSEEDGIADKSKKKRKQANGVAEIN